MLILVSTAICLVPLVVVVTLLSPFLGTDILVALLLVVLEHGPSWLIIDHGIVLDHILTI